MVLVCSFEILEVELHLVSVHKVHDQGVQLVLGQLGLLQDFLQRAEVVLKLLLDVLVHAGPHLAVLDALHVGLDLGNVCVAGEVVAFHVVGGDAGGVFDAGVDVILNSLLQPLINLVLAHVLLLDSGVKLVVIIQDAALPQYTGHVADLLLHLLLLSLDLVGESVSNIKGNGESDSRILIGLSLVAAQELRHSLPVAGGRGVHLLHLVFHHTLHEVILVEVGHLIHLVGVKAHVHAVLLKHLLHHDLFHHLLHPVVAVAIVGTVAVSVGVLVEHLIEDVLVLVVVVVAVVAVIVVVGHHLEEEHNLVVLHILGIGQHAVDESKHLVNWNRVLKKENVLISKLMNANKKNYIRLFSNKYYSVFIYL